MQDRNSGQSSPPPLLAVNSLAPYVLTSLMRKPKRVIYMSSEMHFQGSTDVKKLRGGSVSYADTKLHDLILAKAVARRWPKVYSNPVNPGWVPTKMGGPGAPDSLEKGFDTQVWLATSDDQQAQVTGAYFHHRQQVSYLPAADDISLQEMLVEYFRELTGISF